MLRSLSTNILAAFLTALLVVVLSVPASHAQDKADISAQDKLERTKELIHSDSESKKTSQKGSESKEWKPEGDESLSGAGFRMFQGLALCVGFLLIGSWAYRRWFLKEGPISTRTMKVLERMPLGAKTVMYLVEVEGKRILVSAGAEHSSMMFCGKETPREGFAISLTEACEKDF